MKRRILLVDDEVAVLLTLKAVLEISGFDVDTATSAREGKARIRHREYEMVITDMRMEDERAGEEVITEARNAPYKPAVALLTAFPMDDAAWQDMGADKMLVKPMHTRALLQQLEALFVARQNDLAGKAPSPVKPSITGKSAAKRSATVKKAAVKKSSPVKKSAAKKVPAKKSAPAKKPVAKKAAPAKKVIAKKAVVKKAVKKSPAKKATAKKTAKKR
jgi:DNA-binding response OmpR family regulator